jgi:pantetheine-phosphate adenylyltransferase
MATKTTPVKATKNLTNIAVYPGSFDPITLGHVDIIRRIAKIFDEVVVLIARSSDKSALFSAPERQKLIEQSLKSLPNVRVDSHDGLTVEYARKIGAKILVRGLRAVVDFEYEASMGNINKTIDPEIETLLVFSAPEFYFISSRMVKDVAKNKGPVHELVPAHVVGPLQKKFASKKSE